MTAVEFEDILSHCGGRGRWQWMVFFVASLSGFFNAFHHLGSVFLGAQPDHWCQVPESVKKSYGWLNLTDEQWKNYSIPLEIRKGKEEFSQCRIYERNYSSLGLGGRDGNWSTTTCSNWNFDRSQYTSTIVTEWNLVCQYKALLSTVQATYMAGVFLGCLLYGICSDRFGRRFAILIALVFFTTSGIITSFSVHYIMFIFFRLIIAMSAAGLFTSTFVLTTEIAEPNLRCMLGIFFEIPFAVGYMALSGVAFLIRDWQYLQLAISIPSFLMIIFVWLLPESPRWLISKGKFEEALKVLKKAAKTNNKVLPPDNEMYLMMKICKENEEEIKHTQLQNFGIGIFLALFRRLDVTRRILTVYFTWFVVSMVYYGLALNVKNLGENVYLVNFLNALVEIPAYVMVYFIIIHGGRRIGYCGTFLAGGGACLLILAVKDKLFVTALAILGKFCVTATFAISYLFTAELFPTAVRNVALNSSSMCGRIGSILAPYIVDLLKSDSFNVPMALFGGLAVTAGILALFLPETNKKNLVEKWSVKKDQPESNKLEDTPTRDPSETKILDAPSPENYTSSTSTSTLATNF